MKHRKTELVAIDRRALMKVVAGGAVAGGLLASAPLVANEVHAATVPSNFRAAVHITRQEDFVYAFSSLDTIAKHYKKATGRLIVDGDAVKSLTDSDILGQIDAAKKAGAEIVVASDALSMNGIDPSTLPSYFDTKNSGVIAVMEAMTKEFNYYKL